MGWIPTVQAYRGREYNSFSDICSGTIDFDDAPDTYKTPASDGPVICICILTLLGDSIDLTPGQPSELLMEMIQLLRMMKMV